MEVTVSARRVRFLKVLRSSGGSIQKILPRPMAGAGALNLIGMATGRLRPSTLPIGGRKMALWEKWAREAQSVRRSR
jgi:hypothetical protein